jgi:hypothetical protein
MLTNEENCKTALSARQSLPLCPTISHKVIQQIYLIAVSSSKENLGPGICFLVPGLTIVRHLRQSDNCPQVMQLHAQLVPGQTGPNTSQ